MAKKKSKEIKIDELEKELTEKEDEFDQEFESEKVETEKESEEEAKVEEIEEFEIEKTSGEEAEIEEVFEEGVEEAPIAEEEAPKEEIVDERIYIVPLSMARRGPRGKYAKKSIRFLREYMTRHFKPETIIISQEVNEKIWSRGPKKPPRKLKVRATKNVDGLVVVYLSH